MSHYHGAVGQNVWTSKGYEDVKSHVHSLVREEVTDHGEKFKYRCIECNTRLKRLSGVLVRGQEPRK
jgi:hypothetical protein